MSRCETNFRLPALVLLWNPFTPRLTCLLSRILKRSTSTHGLLPSSLFLVGSSVQEREGFICPDNPNPSQRSLSFGFWSHRVCLSSKKEGTFEDLFRRVHNPWDGR